MLDENKQKLVLDNMNLVYYIARKLGYIDDEDALQYGFLGLCKAADNFDESRGTKFSTYAYPYISNWLAGTYSDIKLYKQMQEGNFVDEDVLSYISVEDNSDGKEELEEVISKAKPKLQIIFKLLLYGYSRKEVSEIINKSQSTISTWISKFREDILDERNQSK
ncbi:MAG: sigma-70 family RNA polymerase sigma factor [Bacilli bacterium]